MSRYRKRRSCSCIFMSGVQQMWGCVYVWNVGVWGCICTGASQLPKGSMGRAKHERETEREGARDIERLYKATAHTSREQDYTTLWLPHLSVCKRIEQWLSDSSQTSSARGEDIMEKMWIRGHRFKCDRVQLLWILSSVSLSSILRSGPIYWAVLVYPNMTGRRFSHPQNRQ